MPHSLTGRYLADELHIQIPPNAGNLDYTNFRITGARAHT